MRPFPRAAIRRSSAACALSVVMISLLAGPVATADELKDRERGVRQSIKRANADLAHSSKRSRLASRRLETARVELREARAELVTARQRLIAARQRDAQMRGKLATAESRLAESEQLLDAGQSAVEVQRADVVDTIVETVQEGDPRLRAFASLLNSEDPADLIRLNEARDVMLATETRAYDELKAAQVLLQVNQAKVESARDEVALRRKSAAENLDAMRELHVRTKRASAQVRDRVLTRRVASRQAVTARQRDARLLRKLKSEERRIKARIAAAARRAERRQAGRHRLPAAGFLRPTAGYVSSPFGYRTHPIYGYRSLHNGVDIAAPCGTPVYAMSSGRVLSRYYSGVYGNRLFVGLGVVNGRYMTAVYNHMARSTVRRGSRVARGQLVGYVGDTGWSTGCHLHLTLLAGGRPVDPENYY